jgi:hypothetical protein
LSASLEGINDIDVLKELLKQAITVSSVPEFQIKLDETPIENLSEE